MFDIYEAQTLNISTLPALKNHRNEHYFTDIFKKSQQFDNQFNIYGKIPRIANNQCNHSNILSKSKS